MKYQNKLNVDKYIKRKCLGQLASDCYKEFKTDGYTRVCSRCRIAQQTILRSYIKERNISSIKEIKINE